MTGSVAAGLQSMTRLAHHLARSVRMLRQAGQPLNLLLCYLRVAHSTNAPDEAIGFRKPIPGRQFQQELLQQMIKLRHFIIYLLDTTS